MGRCEAYSYIQRGAMKYKLQRLNGTLIDAQFTLHTGASWTEVALSSSGGSPGAVINPEYTEGLQELLERLGKIKATLVGVVLSSNPYSKHAVSERILSLERYRYPLQLAEVSEASVLRTEITKAASHTLSESVTGGNPRRRISLLVSLQENSQTSSEAALAVLLSAQPL
jgi:hypothetical protein